MHVQGLLRSALWLSLVGLFACADSERVSLSLSDYGIDDGAGQGEATSADVDGSKDVSLVLKTGAELMVPQGAVDLPVKLGLERPEDTKALNLVSRLKGSAKIASAPYVLTPHGTLFKQEVSVVLPVAEAKAGKKLVVAWLEDEEDRSWKKLGVAEVKDKKATVKVGHFSVVLLVEEGTDLSDAGVDEPQVDAGFDAAADSGAGMDGGGTGIGDGQVEAGTVSDASIDVDSSMGPGGGDATMPVDAGPTGLLGRLYECDLVLASGQFYEPIPKSSQDQCLFDCLLAASCQSVQADVCFSEPSDQSFYNCTDGCWYRDCLDQLGAPTSAYVCDGEPQCADGSDEDGCEFDCKDPDGGVASIPSYLVCDGNPDCRSGEDEADCAGQIFTCGDSMKIPMHAVCDNYQDCQDNSDEPADCLKPNCDPNVVDSDAGTSTDASTAPQL